MRILLVGGNFDSIKGKPSKIVLHMAKSFYSEECQVTLHNGGHIDTIPRIYQEAQNKDVVVWFPNIPNSSEKKPIRDFKRDYPKVLLVTSKRNIENKYSFSDLINHALGLKSNLLVEFTKKNTSVFGRILDPLGNEWGFSGDFKYLTGQLLDRILFLRTMHREKTVSCSPDASAAPSNEKEFYQLVKERADIFHELIHPASGVERFLGNASFRCAKGFPSLRDGNSIYVSKRNVDKRYITPESFVRVNFENCHPTYWGPHKPSVDTPIQLRLYAAYPKVRYMLHAHVYIKDAPFTDSIIPCGALEEYYSITQTHTDNALSDCNFGMNLRGHGSIVLSDDIDYMRSIKYYAKPLPEIMGWFRKQKAAYINCLHTAEKTL